MLVHNSPDYLWTLYRTDETEEEEAIRVDFTVCVWNEGKRVGSEPEPEHMGQ